MKLSSVNTSTGGSVRLVNLVDYVVFSLAVDEIFSQNDSILPKCGEM